MNMCILGTCDLLGEWRRNLGKKYNDSVINTVILNLAL